MTSQAKTVEDYLASLPADRRAAIETVRKVILENLDDGFEEGMQYGMIGYYVPHSIFPAGYHCAPKQPLPFAGLASQKKHMAVYMMCVYGDPTQLAQFQQDWAKTGKKLDMGASCVRFKKLEDLPVAVIGKAIARAKLKTFVATYQSNLDSMLAAKKKKKA